MKRNIVFVLALAAVMSLAGCGSQKTETGDQSNTEEAVTTTTTTAAAAETEAPQETSGEAETTSEAAAGNVETTEETQGAVTTTAAAGELDLDAMMSSIEAEIPDITVFTGMDDIKVDINIGNGKTTTTTAAAKKPEETTTTNSAAAVTKAETTVTAAPATGNINSLFTFIFDGTTYSLPISGSLPLPAGWKVDSSASRTVARYANAAYEGCQIDEVERGGDTLNGVFVSVIEAKKKGSSCPALQMFKGITWGATVDDIKAQYGEPVHTGNYEQYGSNMTSLYYQDSVGSTIILEVSDKYGLALIEMYKN